MRASRYASRPRPALPAGNRSVRAGRDLPHAGLRLRQAPLNHMHEWKELQSQETDREQRLDRFLAEQLPELSRARLQEMIRAGAVLRDGTPLTRPAEKLRGGEALQVRMDPRPPLALEAQEL